MRFTILLLVICSLTYCSEPPQKQILVGKWRYDVEATKASVKNKAMDNMEFRTMENILREANNLLY